MNQTILSKTSNTLEKDNFNKLTVKVNQSNDNILEVTQDGLFVEKAKNIQASDVILPELGDNKTAKGQGLLSTVNNTKDFDFDNHTDPESYYIPKNEALNGPNNYLDSIITTKTTKLDDDNNKFGYQLATTVLPKDNNDDDKYLGSIFARGFTNSTTNPNSYVFGPWVRQLNDRHDFKRISDEVITVYVDSENGDDSLLNDGSKEHPFKTLNHTIEYLRRLYNPSITVSCYIYLKPGDYTIQSQVNGHLLSKFQYINFIRDLESTGTVTISPQYNNRLGFYFFNSNLFFRNITFTTEVLIYDAVVSMIDCTFMKNIQSYGSLLSMNGIMKFGDSVIDDECDFLIGIQQLSYLTFGYSADIENTMTLNGGHLKYGTFYVSNGSVLHYGMNLTSITGNVTGRKYYINLGGGLYTSGHGITSIPGTEDGYLSDVTGSWIY